MIQYQPPIGTLLPGISELKALQEMGNFSFDHILTLIRSRVGESGEFETPLK
jgi:hypothetical protein